MLGLFCLYFRSLLTRMYTSRLRRHCLACGGAVLVMRSMEAGSRPIWPLTKTMLHRLFAYILESQRSRIFPM
jgi:hypothetical protein